MPQTDFIGPSYYADPYYRSEAYRKKLADAQAVEKVRQALGAGESTPETLAYARYLNAVENDATLSRDGFKGFRHNDDEVAREYPFLTTVMQVNRRQET